jgi:hypothetical protein
MKSSPVHQQSLKEVLYHCFFKNLRKFHAKIVSLDFARFDGFDFHPEPSEEKKRAAAVHAHDFGSCDDRTCPLTTAPVPWVKISGHIFVSLRSRSRSRALALPLLSSPLPMALGRSRSRRTAQTPNSPSWHEIYPDFLQKRLESTSVRLCWCTGDDHALHRRKARRYIAKLVV